ncbi:hypothetical protein Acsp06_14970 [Actinomycetospora sp. NBRC 106375]|nr:hypothetical protein Acsp06_14970 [Actinomycetospora sp. NBRC 106375]
MPSMTHPTRPGTAPHHTRRPHPLAARLPRFDESVQYDVIRDSLMPEEHIDGVYASDSAIALCGLTNRRVILLDTAFPGARAALITAPYSRITTVAFVSTEDDPIFSRTVAIQIGRTFYEVACRGEEQAAEIHDLVTWHLIDH